MPTTRVNQVAQALNNLASQYYSLTRNDESDGARVNITSATTPSDFGNLESATTITGGALNAGVAVHDGVMYLCEHDLHKVSFWDVFTDPSNPVKINEIAVGFNPRWITHENGYLHVTCSGSSSVEVWNTDNSLNPIYLGALATETQPKNHRHNGNLLYVGCQVNQAVQEFTLTYEPFGVTKTQEILGVGVTIFGIAFNGENLIAAGGNGNNIVLINSDDFTKISQTALGTGNHPEPEFYSANRLLIPDIGSGGQVHTVDTTISTAPVIISSVNTENSPEQIKIWGDVAYVPSLTADGVQSYLNYIDISDVDDLSLFASPTELNTEGAGFLDVYQRDNDAYTYVSGHFAPITIDTVKIKSRAIGIDKVIASKELYRYIAIYAQQNDELDDTSFDLLSNRWIDSADEFLLPQKNAILDILGNIVGQSRFLDNGIELNDKDYKLFIRARAAKNISACDIPSLIDQIKFILNLDSVLYVINAGNATCVITFGEELSGTEKSYILNNDILPRAAGVRYEFQEYSEELVIGLLDEDLVPFGPNIGGLGDETAPDPLNDGSLTGPLT